MDAGDTTQKRAMAAMRSRGRDWHWGFWLSVELLSALPSGPAVVGRGRVCCHARPAARQSSGKNTSKYSDSNHINIFFSQVTQKLVGQDKKRDRRDGRRRGTAIPFSLCEPEERQLSCCLGS